MKCSRCYLEQQGFRRVATLDTHIVEGFAFGYAADVSTAKDVVYVALQSAKVIYVGKTRNFRSRYNKGHIRWLRGEKGNSEKQRVRWLEVIRQGPVDFYAKNENHPLEEAEATWAAKLKPTLNVAGFRANTGSHW